VRLGRQALWLVLASLIFAAFNKAQTSLALHSLNAKIGRVLAFLSDQTMCLTTKRWLFQY